MLDTLITSKTRIKLLLKFFSNSNNAAYLRSLAEEFGESTNSVRVELNRLTEAGLLESEPAGNTVLYKANTKNTLFEDIRNMVSKYLGFDRIVEQVIEQLGTVELALVTGDYAKGKDSGIIDLTIVGEIDQNKLMRLVGKAESLINRKIRPLVLNHEEYQMLRSKFEKEGVLIIWGSLS